MRRAILRVRTCTRSYPGALLLLGLWVALQALGGPSVWDYAPTKIANGELWRALSAHFVHLNPAHLALNVLGLLAVVSVWHEALRGMRPLWLAVLMGLGISLGLSLSEPHLMRYAGASGVLHGLFAAGAVLSSNIAMYWRGLALLGLVGKLLLETQFPTGSSALIGAPVIHAAHQWGALSGFVLAIVWRSLRR